MPVYRKTSAEIQDLVYNWEPSLDSGDYIISATWTVPTGVTVSNTSSAAYTTSMRLSGGTTGRAYSILTTVNLHSGQKYSTPLSLTIGG